MTNPLYPTPSAPLREAEPLAPQPFERREPKMPWNDAGAIPSPPPYDNGKNRRQAGSE